jgi:7-carboxy-7-deazaguanine synthase
MTNGKKYPIAEIFCSPQGEGLYTGTLMTFIRFAGCSVGKKIAVPDRQEAALLDPDFGKNVPLPIYTEKCCTYDGREFLCDTDFSTKRVLTTEEILAEVPKGVHHLCLTGGEPLDQPLEEFLSVVEGDTGLMVHIETSGTVDIHKRAWPKYTSSESLARDGGWIWLTVSPKRNVLPDMVFLADEIKLLVDKDFDLDKVPPDVLDHELVFIQPINHEFSLDRTNLDRCLELLKVRPAWRLSTQMHKVWGVR